MPYPKFWTPEKLTKLHTLYNSGLSMAEVGNYFQKSVWAINSVMKRKGFLRRPAHETRNIQFLNSPLSYSPKLNLSPFEERLKIAGLMLYWAEGAKSQINGQINFANTDAEMIKLFLKFLRTIYRIRESKLRCHLYCYQNQNIKRILDYWSSLSQIPSKQFIKPYLSPKRNNNHVKITNGVCHIVYADKRLFETIQRDIHDLSTQLTSWGVGVVKRA